MMAPALRKAAILVSALDRDAADALLQQMPEEQSAQVRNAVMELAEIDPAEQEAVLREFFSGPRGTVSPLANSTGAVVHQDDGVELRLGGHAHGATSVVPPTAASPAASPAAMVLPGNLPPPVAGEDTAQPLFQHLANANTATLSTLLRAEHPQVAAVVVANLPPRKAAALIESFDEQLQIDILHRVAALHDADPDSMRQLDRELSTILSKLDPASQMNDIGVRAVAEILEATSHGHEIMARMHSQNSPLSRQIDPSHAGEVLGSVTQPERTQADHAHNREDLPTSASRSASTRSDVSASSAEASPVQRLPAELPHETPRLPLRHLSFTEITRLPDADLAILLRAATPQVVLFALLGATPAFVNRLMGQLPSADAKKFRARFHQATPLALEDVDEAQRRLGVLAAELIDAGRIQQTRAHFAAAA